MNGAAVSGPSYVTAKRTSSLGNGRSPLQLFVAMEVLLLLGVYAIYAMHRHFMGAPAPLLSVDATGGLTGRTMGRSVRAVTLQQPLLPATEELQVSSRPEAVAAAQVDSLQQQLDDIELKLQRQEQQAKLHEQQMMLVQQQGAAGQQPMHWQAMERSFPHNLEQVPRYSGALDVDEQMRARAAEINQSYWDSPGEKTWWNKPGFYPSLEDMPPYPFQRIKSSDGQDTGVVALIAPFYDLTYYRAEMARALFWRMKGNGQILIGMSSYQEYPGKISNPYDDRHTTEQDWEIFSAMDGWLHCFREPDKVIPPGVPRVLLSNSDFHDADRNDDGGVLKVKGLEKKFDLIYRNSGGEWNDWCRNWTFAKEGIKAVVASDNLTVLISGRDLNTTEDQDLWPFIQTGNIVSEGFIPWNQFLDRVEQSRALITFNVYDASPRVLVEALCKDIPVLINWHIVGGWKYANEMTGEFFEDTSTLINAWRRLQEPQRRAQLAPRRWFKDNYGLYRSNLFLQAFLEVVVGKDRLKAAREYVLTHNVEP